MIKKEIILLFLVAAVCFTSCQDQQVQRPNIVWILAEDLSQDIACYGNDLVKTPTLDQLAKDGVRYTNVFTTAPVCTPSRTALATGMYQTSINAHHMRYPEELKNPLPEDVLPINEIFRRNGYQTANIKDKPGTGKTDWSFKSEKAHFDLSSWDEIEPERPFFAVVSLRLTHRPFERDSVNPINPDDVMVPPYYPDRITARKDFGEYLESVQLMDREVATVIGEIDQRGWSGNTIVIFFGDHGRPFTRAKTFLYDTGIKIPLIIIAPESSAWSTYLPAASVNEQLISAIDISATSLAMAEINKPSNMDGRVILGPHKEAERASVYSAADRIGEIFSKSRSVRNKQFKYIRNYKHDFSVNSASTAYRKAAHPIYQLLDVLDERNELDAIQKQLVMPLPEEELYNLQSDPFEINNIADDPKYLPVLEKMRSQLMNWQDESNDYGMFEDSPELTQAFVDYGIQSSKKKSVQASKLRKRVEAEIELESKN